jgi:hypothetical protein
MSAYRKSFKSISIRFLTIAMATLLIGVLASCRTAPVTDVERVPIPPTATEQQVQQAIIAAGAGLGWVMKVKRPGLIVGTLSVRSHLAEVEIPYTRTSYSIRYKSSSNLDYDPTKRTIHSNYTGWIQNLDRAIRASLAAV